MTRQVFGGKIRPVDELLARRHLETAGAANDDIALNR
jgi:hypothetical protein